MESLDKLIKSVTEMTQDLSDSIGTILEDLNKGGEGSGVRGHTTSREQEAATTEATSVGSKVGTSGKDLAAQGKFSEGTKVGWKWKSGKSAQGHVLGMTANGKILVHAHSPETGEPIYMSETRMVSMGRRIVPVKLNTKPSTFEKDPSELYTV